MSTLVDFLGFIRSKISMKQGMTTKEKLRLHARRQFWTNGYSNVSVRQIAKAASVDVALISRNFGGKLGLFRATISEVFDIFDSPPQNSQALVDGFVQLFVEAPRKGAEPSPIRMLLTNAHDDTVGEMVRNLYNEEFQTQISNIVGCEKRSALFMAIVFGISVAEKSLQIKGISEHKSQEYEAQLRHLMQSALDYPTLE